MRTRPGILCGLLLGISFFLLWTGVALATTMAEMDARIKAEKERLATVEKQIKYNKKQVSVTQKKEQKVLGDLANLTEQISLSQEKISLLELQNEKTQLRLRELNGQITATEARLGDIRDHLRERVIAIYKYGGVAEMEMLLACDNLHDAMEASYLLNKMAEGDRRLFQEGAERKRLLDASKKEALDRKRELQERLMKRQDEARILRKNIKKRNAFLEKLREQRRNYVATAKALEKQQKEEERNLTKLLKAKQALAEKKRGEILKKPDTAKKLPPLRKPGRLAWPLRGTITSPFGMRIHPVFKTRTRHTGIDIDGELGDPVKAAEVGEVLFAGILRGYGQIIIIDHGGGLSTVYAHLSRILVREGHRVKTGQVIGKVGSTGTSTGTHLHFEVRQGGKAQNPMKYLGS